ncbi:carbohydrate-binding module family 48 protein [Aulographum hederae CBS 113979]|uniref:Carbohydrate-binding module family 48 protein n=1 Tax=Aulographum hederae CBS 113979 TaxID=1176131 RepID=A0A6G1GR07_9PEZI|nr:carbohydrate-binding module family 48 protein [Aulographum hederae CBS 113979]
MAPSSSGPSKHKGPHVLSAYLPLAPGTHHIKFIVDGDMCLSKNMPTAVDFTNILVNYIEIPVPEPASAQPVQPVADGTAPVPSVTSETATTEPTQKPASHIPPQVVPPTPEQVPAPAQDDRRPSTALDTTAPGESSKPAPVKPAPPKQYHSTIPQFLLDLDAVDQSPAYAKSSSVANTLPAPPSLPGFLGKSILNSSVQPMKDDASVLIMPNHTVLNHLATSSIRQGVLATSATTRYKRKFLTTIMYRPTNDGSD